MATITTRAGKGSPLTNTEVDDNFSNLNSAKYESGSSPTFANSALLNSSSTVSLTLDGASANSKNIYFKGDSSAQMGRIASIGTSLYFQLTDATNYFTINPGSTVINDSSVDHDFRVESNSNTHALFVDASTNRLGINTSSPSFDVDIQGANPQVNIEATTDNWSALRITSGATQANYMFFFDDTAERARISVLNNEKMNFSTGSTPVERLSLRAFEAVFNDTGVDADFRVESDTNTHALFVDAGNDRVGVGVSAPATKLHIASGINGTPTTLRIENLDTTIETDQEVNSIEFYSNDTSASGIGVSGKIAQIAANPGNQYDLAFFTYNTSLAEAMRLTENGRMGIGVDNPPAPLSVHKTPDASYGVANFAVPSGNPTWVTLNRDGSQDGGFKIQRSTTADMRLFVNSDEATVLNYNGGNTGDSFQIIQGAGSGALVATFDSANNIIFNENSGDQDFRVESDANSHMLFVDGGNNKIGINESHPAASLDIRQSTNGNTDGILVRPVNESQSMIYSFLGMRNTYFTHFVTDSANSGQDGYEYFKFFAGTEDINGELLQLHDDGATFNQGGLDRDFRLESDSNAHMLFVDGGANKVGIGTNSLSRVFNVYHPTTDGAIKLETGGNASNIWSGIEFKTPTSQGFIYVPSNDSTGLMKFLPASSEVLALSNSAVVVNEQSSDVDFRVESNNNANAFRVDAGADQVRTDAVFVHDTNTGTQPFYITRSGGLDQGLAVTVDDNTVIFNSIQDETSGANYLFRSSNATATNVNLLQMDYSSGTVFNQGGLAAQNFRIESDTDAHAFYLNAVNGNIGMGAGASPSLPLSVGSKTGSNLNYINGTANTVSTDSGIFVSATTTNESTVSYGLQLANNSNVADTRSPLIGFSALSASTSYNHTYAAIWGLKSGNGADTNWNTGQLHFGTSDGTGVDTRMKISQVGGLVTLPAANGDAVFNEDGANADFRIESDTMTHSLFVRGDNGRVGIFNAGPRSTLEVGFTNAKHGIQLNGGPNGVATQIHMIDGRGGAFTTLTIDVQLGGAGGYFYQVQVAGTAGCKFQTGGGYTNGTSNFSHSVGSGSGFSVTSPSNNLIRLVAQSGVGTHPGCEIRMTQALNANHDQDNVTITWS
ncbi:hypothetical protein N9E36_02815 [bacterium]|nr:hypothetical protein [bacterium]